MKCVYLFSARVNALFFFSFVLSSSSLFSLLADEYILCVYLSFIRTMRMVFCVRAEGSGDFRVETNTRIRQSSVVILLLFYAIATF